eukprot:m51a1_g7128 hypothetical protein (1438) ;mRNA; f:185953-223544
MANAIRYTLALGLALLWAGTQGAYPFLAFTADVEVSNHPRFADTVWGRLRGRLLYQYDPSGTASHRMLVLAIPPSRNANTNEGSECTAVPWPHAVDLLFPLSDHGELPNGAYDRSSEGADRGSGSSVAHIAFDSAGLPRAVRYASGTALALGSVAPQDHALPASAWDTSSWHCSSQANADLLDVVLVLDSSGSIGTVSWNRTYTAIMGSVLLQSLRVSPRGVNMGIVTFSDEADLSNGMTGDSDEISDLLQTLQAARVLRKRSAARLAMQPQAVVITVTDGGNNMPQRYREYFDESLWMLRDSAPGVLSVLVDTGRETLFNLAEKREAERVVRLLPTSDSLRFPVYNISSLDRALSNLIVAVVATVAATATAVAATVSSSAVAAVAAGAAAAAVAGAAVGAGAVVLGAVALRRIGRIGGRMGDMGGETLRPAPPAPAAPAPPALRESLARVRPPLSGIADALDRFEQDVRGQEGALPAGLGVEGALALVVYTTEDEPREQSVYYRLNHALRRRRHRCRVLCPNDNTTAAEQLLHQHQQPAGAVGDNAERGEGDEAEAEESSWLGYAWRLAAAMRALPVVRGEVYRGVCCPLDAAAYAPGSRVFWNGFTSTSRSRAVASDFAASAVAGAPEAAAAGGATLFEVRVERGRDVGFLNQYGEAEVLLEPGSAFDVDAVAREGPLLVVRMHEVPSDALLFPAAAPPADDATAEALAQRDEATEQRQWRLREGSSGERGSRGGRRQQRSSGAYKFGKVTNIFFGDIFGHVFKCIIGVQAVAQQYMAAKKHSHFTMFEQEVPVICYGSGSNASHTNLTNLSFLYLSMGCQMTCLKYIFSDNGTDITTNSTLTDLINHWEQHFTEPLSWKELTNKPFKSIMWAVFISLSMSIQAISTFEVAIITNIIHIIKLKNYIMTRMMQQAKKTNKGKSFTNNETSVEREAMAAAAAPAAEPELSPKPQQQQDIEPEKANEQPMEQDKNTEQQDGDTEQQDNAEAEQQDKQQDEQEENASIIAISTLTRNRVIPTKEEAVQAGTDCLEVLYFTTPFWDPTENTDKIKGAQQASKETSSASGDEAESSSSESIDELRGKKVVECNVDDNQEEHKKKTTTCKRTREESNEEDQQDQIIKGLEATRTKLKEKIATYKKEQVRVTNELHEQHVLIAMLKSQNEGLKEQLELLKSEHANWREYKSLKGTSTTPSKHKVPTSHPAHPASGLTLVLDNPENQNKNNVVMATLGFLVHCGFVDEAFVFYQLTGHTYNELDQCFSSSSKYFCHNNIMSMPEVPMVFTISWAKWSFLKQFKVQMTYLNSDLRVISAQTNQEYVIDTALVPRNASIIVVREPIVKLLPLEQRGSASSEPAAAAVAVQAQVRPLTRTASEDFGASIFQASAAAAGPPAPVGAATSLGDTSHAVAAGEAVQASPSAADEEIMIAQLAQNTDAFLP